MPLSALIEMLPKTGADGLLYVKVEQGELMLNGGFRVTIYFHCFDATGRLLWNEKASNVLINGANPFGRSSGWKSKLAPHIGKPGLLLKQNQVEGSDESKR